MLLFDDLQDLHGASLDTDAAGNALGDRVAFLVDHNLHGANLDALAALDAQLLVDHVNASLGILSDSASLTDLHALATLDADIGLCSIALCNDLDSGQIGVKLLVECFGASLLALQASHTFGTLFNSELLHNENSPLYLLLRVYYTRTFQKLQ